MHRQEAWYLRNALPLFRGLPESDYQALDRLLTHFQCKAREPVYGPGEEAEYIYILKEGRVRLSQLFEDGREVTLEFLEPGAIFGALGVGHSDGCQLCADSVEDAFLCKISREHFEDFIATRPQLMYGVTKLLGFRLQKIQIRLQTLLFHDVRTRIMMTLKELAKTYGEAVPGGTRLCIKLTHQDIANLIGATRETTTQILSELRHEGLIDFDKKYALIKDPAPAAVP